MAGKAFPEKKGLQAVAVFPGHGRGEDQHGLDPLLLGLPQRLAESQALGGMGVEGVQTEEAPLAPKARSKARRRNSGHPWAPSRRKRARAVSWAR